MYKSFSFADPAFPPPLSVPFVFTVKSDNAGTSASNQFTIPTQPGGTYLYNVSTSDGYSASGLTGSHTITFPSGAGTHTVTITGVFPLIYFNNGGDRLKITNVVTFGLFGKGTNTMTLSFTGCSNMNISATDAGSFDGVVQYASAWASCSSITSFPLINTSNATNLNAAWFGCSALTSFPPINTSNTTIFASTWNGCSALTSFPIIDTGNGNSFNGAWTGCIGLTSFPLLDFSSAQNLSVAWFNCYNLTSFPLIDTSNVINLNGAWGGCNGLTSFPLIDTSNVTNFSSTWVNCSNLTSFPPLDMSSGTNFYGTFSGLSNLTSFPALDLSSGTTFEGAWGFCTSLTTFPPNRFDSCTATNYTNAFISTNLNQTSIDNILISIDTSGVTNGTFNRSGGTVPSAAGIAAANSLVSKGWTVTY